ncbi:spermidine/putrescine ABC transporter ATP-binding protein, partial [Achromobacter xylosoxidans]
LDMVRLPQVGARLPRELSGGQQQRIALARCMVYRPAIILMDEPLGALDKKLRDQMQLEIKRIHRELGTTIVYVTHDQEEAMTMSDRICLMNGGAIEQLGTPADLYFRPRTLFVADFLGESNLLRGEVTAIDGPTLTVRLAQQGVTGQALSNGAAIKVGQKVTLMVRPQNLQAGPAREHGQALTGRLLDVMVTGSLTKLYLDSGAPDSAPLVVAYPTRRQAEQYAIGQPLSVTWQAADAVAIAE